VSVRQVTFLALLVVAAAAVMSPTTQPPPVGAQRATPDPSRALGIYGRRYVVPVPHLGPAAARELSIANVGWTEAKVAVIAIGPGASASCPSIFGASQILDKRCGMTVPAAGILRVPVTVQNATHLLVYSIAAADALACSALDAVAAGQRPLAEWERTGWQPGESIVPSLRSESGSGGGTVVSGQPQPKLSDSCNWEHVGRAHQSFGGMRQRDRSRGASAGGLLSDSRDGSSCHSPA
jgi:hypothetical protein